MCCQADESRTWNRDGVARGCFFGHGLSVRRMKFANLSKLPACPSFEDAHGGRCLWLLSLHQKNHLGRGESLECFLMGSEARRHGASYACLALSWCAFVVALPRPSAACPYCNMRTYFLGKEELELERLIRAKENERLPLLRMPQPAFRQSTSPCLGTPGIPMHSHSQA